MSILVPAPPPPETLNEVSRTIRELQDALEQLDVSIEKPSRSAKLSLWFRRNRNLASVTALTVLFGLAAGSYFLGVRIYKVAGVKLDSRVTTAIDPLSKQIQAAQADTRRLEGMLIVLQNKVLIQQLSALPQLQLREHREELREARKFLATANPETPGFWPATFQMITLLSRATSAVEAEKPKEIFVSDVSGGPFTGEFGERIVLAGQIRNTVFTDAVVRLDPDVHLQNVTFVDCIIIFPDAQKPAKSLRQIASEFLSSDLLRTTIHGS
jgi:hypothetical protein